ncbi:endonuclease/exonuclease/phosphatase family protein [Maribellus luteus]|nr:endonuclease/exonuclease/phosphatase family protein [Maribellus luteus]
MSVKINLLLIVCVLVSGIGMDLHAQNKKLKIINYNVLEGIKLDTTSNHQKFADWVNEQDPDILALQELNSFTQKKLEQLARSFNHPYAVLLKETGYPVGITSKYPIINVEKVLDNMWHGFIKAEIRGYNIFVIHLSPHVYWKRREEIDLILNTSISESKGAQKTIIMGDFNSVSELDADAYQDGRLLERLRIADEKSPAIENLAEGKLDYEVHRKMTQAGYIDAFRLKHKVYDSSALTLRFSENGKIPSRRIDYIYVSKDLKRKVSSASIIKDQFTHYHSDHYPVTIELNIK